MPRVTEEIGVVETQNNWQISSLLHMSHRHNRSRQSSVDPEVNIALVRPIKQICLSGVGTDVIVPGEIMSARRRRRPRSRTITLEEFIMEIAKRYIRFSSSMPDRSKIER
jgi:hypothetical protein